MKSSLLHAGAGTLLFLLFGCVAPAEPPSLCEDLCEELMNECNYPAFPDRDSCQQGCLYNETEGADTAAHLTCVEEAACDTFAIVECENHHGASSND